MKPAYKSDENLVTKLSELPDKFCLRVSCSIGGQINIKLYNNGRFINSNKSNPVKGTQAELLTLINMVLNKISASPGRLSNNVISLFTDGLGSLDDKILSIGIEYWPDSGTYNLRMCQGDNLILDPVLYPAVPGENVRSTLVRESDVDTIARKLIGHVIRGLQKDIHKTLQGHS